MIGSITLKCRFGEKLWFNWRCISPPFFEEERSFFLFLQVYFNWANAILAVKLHCPKICLNI